MFLTMSVGLKDDGKTLQACMKKHRSQMNAAIGTKKKDVVWTGLGVNLKNSFKSFNIT